MKPADRIPETSNTPDADTLIAEMGQRARQAARALAKATTASKNLALNAIARSIEAKRGMLIASNQRDLARAQAQGHDAAFIDRLTLSPKAIDSMLEGLRQVAALPDPVGEILSMQPQPSGIVVGKMRVPLGVIGIIYESRPNVTIDAAALCLKSGNACILRGGSEAMHSNQALALAVQEGLTEAGLPKDAVQLVETRDRAAVGALIRNPAAVDVIIPRGGKSLVARISDEARVPVIKHLDGICHVYLDDEADPTMAIRIADNAKTQRYGTCNTMETLLVARSRVTDLLPPLIELYLAKGVELRVCEATRRALSSPVAISAQGATEQSSASTWLNSSSLAALKPATEEDWSTEYLAPILSIKTVEGLDQAIDFINTYGSQHTEAIVTRNHSKAMRFVREVDSSSVIVNASTRFADGFEYGLGAEIGISTNKLHARGPVGLEGLTTYKWLVLGDGEVRT